MTKSKFPARIVRIIDNYIFVHKGRGMYEAANTQMAKPYRWPYSVFERRPDTFKPYDETFVSKVLETKKIFKIHIEEANDSFTININGKRFHFDQEEPHKGLVKMFKELGLKATYEEVY